MLLLRLGKRRRQRYSSTGRKSPAAPLIRTGRESRVVVGTFVGSCDLVGDVDERRLVDLRSRRILTVGDRRALGGRRLGGHDPDVVFVARILERSPPLRFWTSCQGLCQLCFSRGGERRRAKVGGKGGISARVGGFPDAHGTVPSPLGNADDPDAVGVVSPVAMVAKHHLVFVMRLGALETSLALHALPIVGLDHWDHLPGESKAPRVV